MMLQQAHTDARQRQYLFVLITTHLGTLHIDIKFPRIGLPRLVITSLPCFPLALALTYPSPRLATPPPQHYTTHARNFMAIVRRRQSVINFPDWRPHTGDDVKKLSAVVVNGLIKQGDQRVNTS